MHKKLSNFLFSIHVFVIKYVGKSAAIKMANDNYQQLLKYLKLLCVLPEKHFTTNLRQIQVVKWFICIIIAYPCWSLYERSIAFFKCKCLKSDKNTHLIVQLQTKKCFKKLILNYIMGFLITCNADVIQHSWPGMSILFCHQAAVELTTHSQGCASMSLDVKVMKTLLQVQSEGLHNQEHLNYCAMNLALYCRVVHYSEFCSSIMSEKIIVYLPTFHLCPCHHESGNPSR